MVDAVDVLGKSLTGKTVFPFDRREDFYLAWKSYGWEHTRLLIHEMQQLLENRRIEFVVLVFPISDQVNDA